MSKKQERLKQFTFSASPMSDEEYQFFYGLKESRALTQYIRDMYQYGKRIEKMENQLDTIIHLLQTGHVSVARQGETPVLPSATYEEVKEIQAGIKESVQQIAVSEPTMNLENKNIDKIEPTNIPKPNQEPKTFIEEPKIEKPSNPIQINTSPFDQQSPSFNPFASITPQKESPEKPSPSPAKGLLDMDTTSDYDF